MLRIEEDLCVGCGACIEACPLGLLETRMVDGVAKVGFSRDIRRCTDCMACVDACSEEAITVEEVS